MIFQIRRLFEMQGSVLHFHHPKDHLTMQNAWRCMRLSRQAENIAIKKANYYNIRQSDSIKLNFPWLKRQSSQQLKLGESKLRSLMFNNPKLRMLLATHRLHPLSQATRTERQ
jgi:hypothetical protein